MSRRSVRRRRGRRAFTVVLLLALLWVGGDGLPVRRRPKAAVGTPALALGQRQPPPAEAEGALVTAAEHLQEQDRFYGRLASIRLDLDHGRLSRALRGLDQLRGEPLAATTGLQLADLDQEIADATRAAVRALEADIAAGVAPRAAQRVARMVEGLHARVDESLRALVRQHGWPRLYDVGVPAGLALGSPALLPAGRQVLVEFEGSWCEARTVASPGADGRLTLRVDTTTGVYFPDVAQGEVAPLDPLAVELDAQLRVALRGAQADLASAWLAVCTARGVPLAPELRAGLAAWFRVD